MSHYLLVYDIPERSGITNPSNFLRGFAIRINLSCWIVGENDIPYTYLRGIESQGAKWRIVKFDEREGGSITQMAIDAIQAEIASTRQRTAAVCERAAERAERDMTNTDTLKAYRRRVSTQLKAMRKTLNSLKSAADRFGVDCGSRFTAATDYLKGLHTVCLQRAKTFAETVRELSRENTTLGTGLANGVRAAGAGQAVPLLVSADYLEETGGAKRTALARRVRALFGEPTGGSYFG